MIRRILVALDFGPLCEPVAQHALALARAFGASCLLLHVIEAIEGADDLELDRFYASMTRRAGGQLAERAARFRDAGVEVETEIVVGRRWREIVERAVSGGADLVVIGSHRTTVEGRPHLGGTGHQVFMACPRPLYVVRG